MLMLSLVSTAYRPLVDGSHYIDRGEKWKAPTVGVALCGAGDARDMSLDMGGAFGAVASYPYSSARSMLTATHSSRLHWTDASWSQWQSSWSQSGRY